MLTVRLDKNIERRLNVLSKDSALPKSYYVREALERYMEDLEDIQVALKWMRRADQNTAPLKEVMKRYE